MRADHNDAVRKADIGEHHDPAEFVVQIRDQLSLKVAAVRGVADMWSDAIDLIFRIN